MFRMAIKFFWIWIENIFCATYKWKRRYNNSTCIGIHKKNNIVLRAASICSCFYILFSHKSHAEIRATMARVNHFTAFTGTFKAHKLRFGVRDGDWKTNVLPAAVWAVAWSQYCNRLIDALRPEQNGREFTDDILINNSLVKQSHSNFITGSRQVPTDNGSVFVQVTALWPAANMPSPWPMVDQFTAEQIRYPPSIC